MSVTPATLRTSYTEFADTNAFPDPMITYWISVAGLLLPQQVWGIPSDKASSPPTTIMDLGTELFVAHNLSLEKMANAEASRGITPGVATGSISSKSVNGVSVSYNAGDTVEMDAGHWNLTNYGKRFVRLAKIRGMRPIQIGIGISPPFAFGAWPGPWPFPEQGDTGFGG
jgi:hypothetical protein